MADTESVSVGALVQYVGEVLGRSHALFGDPPDAARYSRDRRRGCGSATQVGCWLPAGGGSQPCQGISRPATRASPAGRVRALDRLAGLEDRVGGVLTDAAGSDRRGRAQSGAVINGAASDTAALAAWSGTPAGQQLLLTRLRGRLIQQRQMIAAYRARDAQLAAMMRAMRYRALRPGARDALGRFVFGSCGTQGRVADEVFRRCRRLTRAAANRNTRRIHLAARHDPRDCAGRAGRSGGGGRADPPRRPLCMGCQGPQPV